MTQKVKVNREYKAALFAEIFSDANNALSLYNAMNGTDYDDPSQLVFTTLKDVIYIGYKNDVSFLIRANLNLYEGQSTWNPNMPLRGLIYLTEMYKDYIEVNGLDIYSSVQLKLPRPKYVVFYNGEKDQPEAQDLRLSDSFVDASGRMGCLPDEMPALECIAHVVNINHGHNQELMRKCPKLWEYSYLIDAIRKNMSSGKKIDAAVDQAVQHCIEQGILTDILAKNRTEVTNMILEEYDEEFHIRCEKELSREEGLMEGREEGLMEGREEGGRKKLIALVTRKLAKGKSPSEIAEDLEEELPAIQMICEAASGFAPGYDCDKIYQKLVDLQAATS